MAESKPRYRLRFGELDRLAERRNWSTDQEIAGEVGVSPAYLCNLRKGRANVGNKIIIGCIRAFGAPLFEVLFEEVVDEPAPAEAVA